jgi:UDP-N-acetylglucosamine 3-dehydrogenase
MASSLRIAVVGVGQIGKVHMNAFKNVKNAEVVAVVDLIEERAKEVKETYGVPDYYVDYRKVLERDDIDAIDICVPTYVHEEIAVASARANKHFLCEKPMTLSMESADRMLAEAEKAGVTHMVAFCRRFDNEWNKVRELIQAGVIGRPVVWRSIIAVRGGSQPLGSGLPVFPVECLCPLL